MRTTAGCFLAAMVVPILGAAPADAPDKSAYSLFAPTPRELLRDLSTDRPDTTESPYTVDAGHFQLEMSFVDYTHDRSGDDDNERFRAFVVAPLLIKAGLLHNVDLQIGIDPWIVERNEDRAAHTHETHAGFGDVLVRLKWNLWGNDAGDTAFALMPFVKFPTARDDLGNQHVEGGIIAPLAIDLGGDWALGLMLELDIVRDTANERYIADLVHTATVSHPLWGELGGYVEFAGFEDVSGEESYRAYFDAGLTYGLSPDVQLDAGIRVGLTDAADDFGAFVGLSVRY
jgi:hypothetical protein